MSCMCHGLKQDLKDRNLFLSSSGTCAERRKVTEQDRNTSSVSHMLFTPSIHCLDRLFHYYKFYCWIHTGFDMHRTTFCNQSESRILFRIDDIVFWLISYDTRRIQCESISVSLRKYFIWWKSCATTSTTVGKRVKQLQNRASVYISDTRGHSNNDSECRLE